MAQEIMNGLTIISIKWITAGDVEINGVFEDSAELVDE